MDYDDNELDTNFTILINEAADEYAASKRRSVENAENLIWDHLFTGNV